MGFFDALRRVLTGGHAGPAPKGVHHRRRLAAAWGLDDDLAGASGEDVAIDDESVGYDRLQWDKKLKRVLDELPDSRPEWEKLQAEARTLHLDADWVARRQVEEFALLIRRVVSDGVVTEEEHRKVDMARDLIGIPEAEAEATLHAIVAEAEEFFGKPVEEGEPRDVPPA